MKCTVRGTKFAIHCFEWPRHKNALGAPSIQLDITQLQVHLPTPDTHDLLAVRPHVEGVGWRAKAKGEQGKRMNHKSGANGGSPGGTTP